MIHYGLAGSPRFRGIVKDGGIIVVDGAYVYEWAFGSHMRCILEKIKLTTKGLQFAANSATIDNPYEIGGMILQRRHVMFNVKLYV